MSGVVERGGALERSGAPLLELTDLHKEFGGGRRGRGVAAVDGVSLSVHEGETLALVGESGCGKTTLTRLLLRLTEPTAGSVSFDGRDLGTLTPGELRGVRREMQVVLQDPYSSMNPRLRIADIVAEPLVTHDPAMRGRRGGAPARLRERVGELLESVGLDAGIRDRYPHEFSGGQRQRISIARALALSPRLVVLDEPTSALDVSVQAAVLDLLATLQREHGLTYVFVSHNLAVVAQVADRVAVMRAGRLVEVGDAASVFTSPKDPYTRELLDAVPDPDPRRARQRRAEAARASGTVAR
jgi:peptide/nickel transport system ATP-binding protein/oligopeptide transport system ATP-binding protein